MFQKLKKKLKPTRIDHPRPSYLYRIRTAVVSFLKEKGETQIKRL